MLALAYKIMTAGELRQMRSDEIFMGSAVDIADGFIHLSSAAQVTATWEKHFAGAEDLVICAVDLTRLGDSVRWESSRGGQLFPHVYGPLPPRAVTAAMPVRRSPDGEVCLPS